ncbi:MAG: hypothetical protein M1818_006728 [Claussenomyces sp. TS43310]|nr:MAG: hypothetical protein M1818_006728 [Claussenomyces sp. TS43310]
MKFLFSLAMAASLAASALALPVTEARNAAADEKSHSDAALYGPVTWNKARDEPHSDAALYGPVTWNKARDEPHSDAALYGPVKWDKARDETSSESTGGWDGAVFTSVKRHARDPIKPRNFHSFDPL